MTTPIFILSMVIIAWCINQVAKHGNEMLYPEQTNTTPIGVMRSHQLTMRRQKVYRLYLDMVKQGNMAKIAQAKLLLAIIDQRSLEIMKPRFTFNYN